MLFLLILYIRNEGSIAIRHEFNAIAKFLSVVQNYFLVSLSYYDNVIVVVPFQVGGELLVLVP